MILVLCNRHDELHWDHDADSEIDKYEFELQWRSQRLKARPGARCAATYVNDYAGSDRSAENKRAQHYKLNCAFCVTEDRHSRPYIFLQTLKLIREGGGTPSRLRCVAAVLILFERDVCAGDSYLRAWECQVNASHGILKLGLRHDRAGSWPLSWQTSVFCTYNTARELPDNSLGSVQTSSERTQEMLDVQ